MMLRAGAAHPGMMVKCTLHRNDLPAPPPFTRGGPGTHPADSSASVLSIICPQDLEEDVGVGSVVGELQETGKAAHPKLQGENK